MKKWIALNFSLPLVVWFLIPDGRYEVIFIFAHMVVLPVSVICLNFISVFKGKAPMLLVAGASLVGVVCGVVISYIRWGVDSGKLFNPDGETIWIIEKLLIYQICFVAGGLVIIAIIKSIKRRISQNGLLAHLDISNYDNSLLPCQ